MEDRLGSSYELNSVSLFGPFDVEFGSEGFEPLSPDSSDDRSSDKVEVIWRNIIYDIPHRAITGLGFDYFYSTTLPLGISRLAEEEDERRLSITAELVSTFLRTILHNSENSEIVEVTTKCLSSLAAEEIIDGEYFERQIWPQILEWVKQEGDCGIDFATISLIGNFSPFIGCDVTERLLVPLFVKYTSSRFHKIRSKCACFIGDFCNAVKSEKVKLVLLQEFAKLCKDESWSVRGTCTHAFAPVSVAFAPPVRRAYLTPLFISLIEDPHEFVQLCAYGSLGLFISTFADPPTMSINYNERREMVMVHKRQFEYNISESIYKSHSRYSTLTTMANVKRISFKELFGTGDKEEIVPKKEPSEQYIGKTLSSDDDDDTIKKKINPRDYEQDYFSDYWKAPLPNIDLSAFNPFISIEEAFEDLTIRVAEDPFPFYIFDKYDESEGRRVPQILVDYFLSMANTRNASLRTFCAKTLPAVVLTLKDENWESVREAYKLLTHHSTIPSVLFSKKISNMCKLQIGSDDIQYEFAKNIACSSIHELADILGEDVTNRDLFPLFNKFIMVDYADKYEQIPQFLKFLKPVLRSYFLPRLASSLNEEDPECWPDWESDCRAKGLKWRKRLMKAKMIRQIIGFFTPQETCEHLKPSILTLLLDKVADVRKAALIVAAELVSHVSIDVGLLRSLLAELAQTLAYCTKWNRRQTFIYLCSQLVSERVLSQEIFCAEVLPHLLELAWDVVPNVRLSLANLIANDIFGTDTYIDPESAKYKVLLSVLKRFQVDKDRDVRYSANQFFPSSSHTPQTSDSLNLDNETTLCDHTGLSQVETASNEEVPSTM